jgi:hypothetical protein
VRQHVRRGPAARPLSGFTLIELLIALALGMVVLGAAMSFLITHMRSVEGSDIRENVQRNIRYVAEMLHRDLQMVGIDIKTTASFGTLVSFPGSPGDTLIVLYIPGSPTSAPAHEIDLSALPEPPAGEGTCGDRCLDLLAADVSTLELAPGDLARLQVDGVRRLILISDITAVSSTQFRLEFTDADTLLHHPASLVGNLQVKIPGTFVQKLQPIIFYLDDQERLLRARKLNSNGTPAGEVAAYGVEQFDVALSFADGDEAPRANPDDADVSNDCDDVIGAVVNFTVKAPRADPRVNHGELLRKSAEVRVSPRNLSYEKDRRGG